MCLTLTLKLILSFYLKEKLLATCKTCTGIRCPLQLIAHYDLSFNVFNYILSTLYSSVHFQIREKKSCNWWLWRGIQEGGFWRQELGVEAGDWRWKRRREGLWAAVLCGSFYCPFLSPIKESQHKLKVIDDIPTPDLHTHTHTIHYFASNFPTIKHLLSFCT